MEQKLRLNIGCGKDYCEGYLNCDWTDRIKVDKVVNLEEKLPFKDNSVDEVLAYHVLEHIKNFIQLIHELYRVCKKGSIIYVKTPFYSAWGQFNDPTHVRFFTPWTFNYFNQGTYSHEVSSNKVMFKIKAKINFGIGESSKLNKIFNPIINLDQRAYCRFFAWIFPSAELEYVLEVIK